MGTPLLSTKLNIPPRRPNLVPRPRLAASLDEALRLKRRLILVSATAGSGKTTLVSEWSHQQERPAAWLSLDANDNDPRRFLNYLIAAFSSLDIIIPPVMLSHLQAPVLPQAETLFAELINAIAVAPAPFLLVLDDYHLIQNEWIHQAVGFVVEHQPLEMHLVLITRVNPPLPLARLRGRGLIAEIRDQDLRFTMQEADQFLNEVMGLGLSAEAVSTLGSRTEGWVVGLQMAAISMQSRRQETELAAFVKAFGGTHRFILDYLMEEVLNQQPAEVQAFLIETSILGRMCGDLCDALRAGEASTGDNQAVLVLLERTNLFVTALDDERRWYRYHHLFADLLNSALRQRRSAEEIRTLHRRASQWHQKSGSLEEAMTHAMAAQDFEQAASMIEENIVSMLSRSETPTLLGWIEKLPEQIVRARPWIDVYRANTLALSGRLEQVAPLLEEVEKRINPGRPQAAQLLGHIAAIRAYVANLRGDAARVLKMAALTDGYLPQEHLAARGMVAYALADTHFANDNMQEASQAALDMLKVGEETGRLLMAVPALCDLAATKKVQGQLHQAQELYSRAHQWMTERNGLDTRVRCPYEIGLADLLREWNQLEAAYEHVLSGIDYCQRFGVYSLLASGYITLMRVLQAQGDVEGALQALYDGEHTLQTYPMRLATRIEFNAARVVQWLVVGEVETAQRWVEECSGGSELEQIALARLRLAQGRIPDAQHLLDRQRVLAEKGGRSGRLVEILALQAVSLEALGRSDEAETTLDQALSLSRAEGFLRVFLDLGEPFCELLGRLAAPGTTAGVQETTITPIIGGYERDLLEACQQAWQMQKARAAQTVSKSPSFSGNLVDPLTARELDVLHLLAEGLSNKQIASKLIVAPSTVKQHLKNIYVKLDVHSRTQAVVRAREIDLL
jgi:LuxR family maltose regulon positive regulatory protein